jgi:hypothetical protein
MAAKQVEAVKKQLAKLKDTVPLGTSDGCLANYFSDLTADPGLGYSH